MFSYDGVDSSSIGLEGVNVLLIVYSIGLNIDLFLRPYSNIKKEKIKYNKRIIRDFTMH